MRALLIGLAVLLVLAVAAILIGPGLIDWNTYREELAERVEAATGRKLTIEGDLSLTILPQPAFSAGKVVLANVEGGSEPAMARLEGLEVEVDLLPLIQGNVQVRSVRLVKPDILLEVLPDGRANWQFDTGVSGAADPGEGAEETGGGLAGNVAVESFVIVDGTLTYRDAVTGFEERLEAINAEVVAESLRGPFAAEGRVRLRGVETNINLASGRLEEGRATPINATLSMDQPAASTNFAGSLSLHADTQALRGRLKAKAGDLGAALGHFGIASGNGLLARPFALSMQIEADPTRLLAEEISVELGDTGVRGSLSYQIAEPAVLKADLNAGGINLDRWLADVNSAPAAAGGDQDGEPSPAGDFLANLPQDLSASVSLSVDALTFRKQVVRQVRAEAALADGQVEISRVMALLPGGSDISFSGRALSQDGAPVVAGRVEAGSDNLRGLLSWLGLNPAEVPQQRLRRMNLLADVQFQPRRLVLTGIDLDVDVSQVKGGVAIALSGKPAFGAGLTVDRLNLDAYLPADDQDDAAADKEDDPASPAGGGALDAFNANLDLRVGDLQAAGASYRNLHLDATLQDGALALRELSGEAAGGTRLKVSGSASSLGAEPRFDLAVDGRSEDPNALARAAGFSIDMLSRTGALTLKGGIAGSPQEIGLKGLTVGLLEGAVALDGTVVLASQPPVFDLGVDARFPKLAPVAAAFSPGTEVDPRFDALALGGRISGTPLTFTVDDLSARSGPLDVTGRLGVDLASGRAKLDIDLSAERLPVAILAAAAAGGDAGTAADRPSGGSRWSNEPLDLSGLRAADARLKVAAKELVLDDQTVRDANLSASLEGGLLTLDGLSGTLNGGTLDLAGRLDARATPSLDLSIEAEKVNIRGLAPDIPMLGEVRGPVSLNATLAAQGRSEAEMIRALNGEGTVDGDLATSTGKQAGAAGAGQVLGGVLSGLGAKLGGSLGGMAGTVGRITGPIAALGGEAKLLGGFEIRQGIVRPRDLRLIGKRQGIARITGETDLPNWRVDGTAAIYETRDAAEAALIIDAFGPLDEPNYRVRGTAIQQRQPTTQDSPTADQPAQEESSGPTSIIERILPKETQPESGTQQQQEDSKPKAGDVFRGLLKGLQSQ